jgi:hypothetical protein
MKSSAAAWTATVDKLRKKMQTWELLSFYPFWFRKRQDHPDEEEHHWVKQ